MQFAITDVLHECKSKTKPFFRTHIDNWANDERWRQLLAELFVAIGFTGDVMGVVIECFCGHLF